MEVGRLLGLQLAGTGILEESDIHGGCVGDQLELDPSSDEVGQLLLAIQQGNRVQACSKNDSLPPGMDFELSNSDMVTNGDFSMDHSSVFDISESVIEDKVESNVLFGDIQNLQNTCTNQDKLIQKATGSGVAGVQNGTLQVCPENLLNVQVIPINSLQVIPGGQTSNGVQVVTAPHVVEANMGHMVPAAVLLSNFLNLADILKNQVQDETGINSQKSSKLTVSSPQSADNISSLELSREGPVASSSEAQSQGINVTASYNSTTSRSTTAHPVCSKETAKLSDSELHVQSSCMSNDIDVLQSGKDAISGGSRVTCRPNKMGDSRADIQSILVENASKNCSLSHNISSSNSVGKGKRMVSLLTTSVKKKLQEQRKVVNSSKDRSQFGVKKATVLSKSTDTIPVKFQLETENGLKAISPDIITLLSPYCTDMSLSKSNVQVQTSTSMTKSAAVQEIHVDKSKKQLQKDSSGRNFSKGAGNKTNKADTIHKTVESGCSKEQNKSRIALIDKNPSFVCEICNAAFSRSGFFQRHMRIHQKLMYPNTEVSQVENALVSDKNSEKFIQDQQDTTEPNERNDNTLQLLGPKGKKKDHTESSSQPNQQKTVQQKFQCDLCSATFTLQGNMTRHRKMHMLRSCDYRFRCETCGRAFFHNCELKRHMLSHSDDLPFQCDTCGKGYIRKSDLVVHERFHTKERAFKCTMCIKSFYQSGDLNRHIRTRHKGETARTCGHCKKQFTNTSTLLTHLQSQHKVLIEKWLHSKSQTGSDHTVGNSLESVMWNTSNSPGDHAD